MLVDHEHDLGPKPHIKVIGPKQLKQKMIAEMITSGQNMDYMIAHIYTCRRTHTHKISFFLYEMGLNKRHAAYAVMIYKSVLEGFRRAICTPHFFAAIGGNAPSRTSRLK